MSDIFREVEEEVRKDKLLALWKKYGVYVIIAAVALVAGTGLRVVWREYQQNRQAEDAAAFAQAGNLLAEGQVKDAAAAYAGLAKDANGGYAVVAAFHAAQAQEKAGDIGAAVATYDKLAGESEAGPALRDVARLSAAMLRSGEAPLEEMQKRLAPLDADDNPWRFSARELLAAARLRSGDEKGARELLNGLAEDAGTPAGVRARAEQFLAALGGTD